MLKYFQKANKPLGKQAMKYIYWGFGILLGIAAGVFALQTLASERIEVIELHTGDQAGDEVITRLWIIDDGDFSYLRTGADGSGWFDRVLANGEIQVTRNGETQRYTVVQRPDKSEHINALMRQKYGWGDAFMGLLVGGREGSIPLELHPAT